MKTSHEQITPEHVGRTVSPRHRAISGHGHICLGQGKIGVDNGL
jgi:hypothetical protein